MPASRMEFDMLKFTKQDSIVIAVTLGIVLSVPFLIPAFYTTSEITVLNQVDRPPPNGNLMGYLAKPKDIGGDYAESQWCGRGVDCGLYYESPTAFQQEIASPL